MDYVTVAIISAIFGACVGVAFMAVMFAGSRYDDLTLGDDQYNED
jgi:hypothetical protein